MKRSVPILLYHHVSPDREITPAGLERQLRHLMDQGYQSLSIGEAVEFVRGERLLEQPSFVVTFDDGYLDNWVYAFPILERLAIKAVFYLVTDRVERAGALRSPAECRDTRTAERQPGGFLSWKEAREMLSSGLVTFGSHTQTHRNFVRRTPYGDLPAELRQSKALIETELERPCDDLAWPWGDFENGWLADLPGWGYHSAVTTLAGANTHGSSPLRLKRLKIARENLDWLDNRLCWNLAAWRAQSFGLFYGWDRRFKVWRNKESPYAHG